MKRRPRGRTAAIAAFVIAALAGSGELAAGSAGQLVQQATLTAADGAAGDRFGHSMAVSGDTIAVGAHTHNQTRGAVYIFEKAPGGWIQTAKLTASDGASGDLLGYSLALVGDMLVSSAVHDDIGANRDQGSLYIFQKQASGWAQMAKLTASDGTVGDALGSSVAIAEDPVAGATIVAGAPVDDGISIPGRPGAFDAQGSAYVFQEPHGGWADGTQTAKLTALGTARDSLLGASVAIAGDTVVLGAPIDAEGQGSVYVFEKMEGDWRQSARLTALDGAMSDLMGISVAIAGDTIVAAAAGDDVGSNPNQGSVYIFEKPAGGWAGATPIAQLTASDGAKDDLLGFYSMAFAGDTLVVDAAEDDVGSNRNQGSVYVFQNGSDGWVQAARLTASDGAANDHLGYSVAIRGDTVMAGAVYDDVGANEDQGSVHVFGPNQPPSCVGVSAGPSLIAPATREQMTLITLAGASDPDGDLLGFRIDGVTQDEPVTASAVGDETSPDAQLTAAGADSDQVHVRAERNPQLNGRVYRIAYTVSDGKGGWCSGTAGVGGDTNAEVSVPRKKGEAAVDDGDTNSWDSFTGNLAHARA